MKDCFQVNDADLSIAEPPSRQEIGLPIDKFVFCSFCNTYKITQDMFDTWMQILRLTDETVLWLYADNQHAIENMKRRADQAGIESHRLIFADRVEPSQYRGRLRLADLFLDTFPYNAGTTASDALRVGLPLVTLCGESFIARMAGSLLSTMDLEECIASTLSDYIGLAVKLASDTGAYAALKSKVTPQRWMETLGDTAKFCEAFEAALQSIALVPREAGAAQFEPVRGTLAA